jgi:hypothetical protein
MFPHDVSQTDWAYLAGLIDGEGSIYATKEGIVLSVTMTSQPVIAWLGLHFRGKVYASRRNPPRRDVWSWRLMRGTDLLAVLEHARPFMRVRGQQADLALEYLRARRSDKPRIREQLRGANVSPARRAARVERRATHGTAPKGAG